MGRTGSHSSGGHSHSSHSSSSHSHSSHTTSSRSSHSSSHSSGGYHSSTHYSSRPSSRYRRTGYGGFVGGYGGVLGSGMSAAFFVAIAIILFVTVLWAGFRSSAGTTSVVASTVNRERLNGGSFTENCVQDDLGWIRDEGLSEKAMGAKLQPFWDATGVQPYIVMLPYQPEFEDPDYRYDWSDTYYDENIGRDDAMLLVYFDAEPDGYWEMVCGSLTGSVLDPEAKEIIWSVLDSFWSDLDNSVPEAIWKTLKTAGERIMTKTTTGMDVAKYVVFVIAIIAVGVVAVVIMNTVRRHQAEEAEETAKILNTPIQKLGADSDPLVEKYDDSNSQDG